MNKVLFGGALAAIVVAGPAVADEPRKPSPNPCPFVRSIDNFKPVDDYSAIVETSPSRRFLVTFANSCRELKWAWSARVESRPGICLRPGDVIVAGRDGFVDRCFIKSIALLPPKNARAPAAY
ncbi:MAG: hypothetical protein HOP13_07135 [Alphaproteobacteria bacterium]|nr:hypothetical protein [Alphaproteobacteria bacterium]